MHIHTHSHIQTTVCSFVCLADLWVNELDACNGLVNQHFLKGSVVGGTRPCTPVRLRACGDGAGCSEPFQGIFQKARLREAQIGKLKPRKTKLSVAFYLSLQNKYQIRGFIMDKDVWGHTRLI